MTLLAASAFLLVLVLPGAALTWARLRHRSSEHEPLVQLVIEVLCWSAGISSIAMLVLLELGRFRLEPLLWTLLIVTGSAVLVGAAGKRREVPILRFRQVAVLLPAFVLFLALTWPPFHYAIGGTDPGMYVVGGHQIARTGGISLEIPTLASTPPGLFWLPKSIIPAEALPPRLRATGGVIEDHHEGIWTSAMFVTDSEAGEVKPQFLHLWMLWIALSISLFGGGLAVLALPGLAAAGALAFYGAAENAFRSSRVALLALVLLLFNWTFVYFSRVPVSELVSFFYFAGGLWGITRFMRTRSPVHAGLGALLFGLSLFTRVDLLYQLPAFGILFVILFVFRRLDRRWMVFFGVLAGTVVWALAHNLTLSWPYTFGSLCYVGICRYFTPEHSIGAVAALLLGAAGLVVFRRRLPPTFQASGLANDRWRRVAATALLFFFGGFLLYDSLPTFPLVTVKGTTSDWASNERVARFVLALGLPGLLLGLGGVWDAVRRRGHDLAIVFLLLLLLDVWLIHAVVRPMWLIVPYGLRYYVSDLLPLLILFAAGATAELSGRLRSTTWRRGALAGLLGVVLLPSVIVLAQLRPYHAMHSAFSDLGGLASQVERDAVVLFDQGNPLKAFQSPLTTAYGIESHTVYADLTDETTEPALAFRTWMSDVGRPVYLVGAHELDDYGGFPLRPLARGHLTVTEVQQVGQYRHLDLSWFDWRGEYTLYRFEVPPPRL